MTDEDHGAAQERSCETCDLEDECAKDVGLCDTTAMSGWVAKCDGSEDPGNGEDHGAALLEAIAELGDYMDPHAARETADNARRHAEALLYDLAIEREERERAWNGKKAAIVRAEKAEADRDAERAAREKAEVGRMSWKERAEIAEEAINAERAAREEYENRAADLAEQLRDEHRRHKIAAVARDDEREAREKAEADLEFAHHAKDHWTKTASEYIARAEKAEARVAELAQRISDEQECEVCAYPPMVRSRDARVAELETRLSDLARVHEGTLDRLHDVERREADLERRLAAALDRQGATHTAGASDTVAIPRDVAEQVAAAIVACEPYQRGTGLDGTRGEK